VRARVLADGGRVHARVLAGGGRVWRRRCSRLRSEICVARREATLFWFSFGLVDKMRRVIGSFVGADI
jgi:hypothetical protein